MTPVWYYEEMHREIKKNKNLKNNHLKDQETEKHKGM